MKTKHTPGPWMASKKLPQRVVPVDNEFFTVAAVIGFNAAEGEANTTLIAAAPELLEALALISDVIADLSKNNPGFLGKLTLNDYGAYNEAMIAMPRAIAKAKGEA